MSDIKDHPQKPAKVHPRRRKPNTPDQHSVITLPQHQNIHTGGGIDHSQYHRTLRYQPRKTVNWEKIIIPVAAITTGALVALATPQLIDTSGYSGSFKMLLMGCAAGLISR